MCCRWLIVACLLSGCSAQNVGQGMQDIGAALSPQVRAENNQKRAQAAYNQSVEDYRRCLSANPPAACEGQRAIMQANQQVLSAATTAAAPPTIVGAAAGPRTCQTTGLPGMTTTTCY